MTSSLVGSEMCIRDRCPATGLHTGGQSATMAYPHDSKLAGGRSPMSVSYTHLTLPTICSV
eukprot:6775188-Prorocentrum_lima.AAC.1